MRNSTFEFTNKQECDPGNNKIIRFKWKSEVTEWIFTVNLFDNFRNYLECDQITVWLSSKIRNNK